MACLKPEFQNSQSRADDTADEAVVRSAEEGPQPFQMDVALSEAIADNDIQRVRELLRDGHDPNQRTNDDDGYTPLHIAAEYGNALLIEMLALAGGDIEARVGSLSVSPLQVAITSNQTAAAIALLNLGADPGAVNSHGTSCIETAICNGNARLVLALVKRGASVSSINANGWTSLHLAAGLNNPTAIAILVRFGADTNTRDVDDDTPLITSCAMGSVDCVQQLLAGGADPRRRNRKVGARQQ